MFFVMNTHTHTHTFFILALPLICSSALCVFDLINEHKKKVFERNMHRNMCLKSDAEFCLEGIYIISVGGHVDESD